LELSIKHGDWKPFLFGKGDAHSTAKSTALDFLMKYFGNSVERVAVKSAKNHKRQRRKRQSVTAKREKSQTPKVLTAILTLPNLTSPNLT